MTPILEQLLRGEHLSEVQAGSVLRALTDPEVSDAVKGALLVALRAKGETAEELRGMAVAMREAARRLPGERGLCVDTCGTGGDGSDSINLSTAAALVVAAAGVPVVKHGNRSISSRSGSADVLEALGLVLPDGPEAAAACLDAHGFAFLFAPAFHPAMKAVVPVRRAMGIRTIFNVLGPLTNPARPAFQLVGAYSAAVCALMAEALTGMDVERAFVVHGARGWDEATPIGPFELWRVAEGRVVHEHVDPRERYGLERCSPADLAGGDAERNARALRAIFAGEAGPQRDAVLLSAALVLELLGETDPRAAFARAASAIDSGATTRLVDALAR